MGAKDENDRQGDTISNRDREADILLAEFEALRDEIEWLIKNENTYMSLAITLFAAIIAFNQFFLDDKFASALLPVLLVIPIPFLLFAALYQRQHLEVHIVASYISNYLRPQVRKLCSNGARIWQWEEWKAHITSTKASSRFAYLTRILVFLLPVVLSLLLACYKVFAGPQCFQQSLEKVYETYRGFCWGLFGLLLLDIGGTCAIVFRIWHQRQQCQEILNARIDLSC